MGAMALLVSSLASLSCGGSGNTKQPATALTGASQSIQGSYILISRELPDGTVLRPPEIMGLFTYTETHRNFTIVGADAMGKFFISRGATYTFSPTEYSETQLFNIANDASDRTQVVYDVTAATVKAPVTVSGDRVQFKPGAEPVLTFEGTTLTATQDGQFVDTWERIP